MKLLAIPILLLCLHSPGFSQTEKLKTASEWYEYVQSIRGDANQIWRKENPTQDELRRGIAGLENVIKVLNDPKIADLRKQDFLLRIKDQDIYGDLIAAYAKLNDYDGIKRSLTRLLHLYSLPENADGAAGFTYHFMEKVAEVRAARDKDPQIAEMMDKVRALGHNWEIFFTNQAIDSTYSESISLEQRIAGFSTLWSELRFNFAFFDRVKFDLNKAYADTLPEVIAAKTTFDYYQILRRFCASLNDAHTNVYLPAELRKAHFGGRPPIRTIAIDGRVYVRQVYSQTARNRGIAVGDELLAIDGVPVTEYAEKNVAPYESASTPQDRAVRIYDYFLLSGPATKPVNLQIQKPKGGKVEVVLDRSGYKDIVVPPNGYVFSVRDGIGVVQIDNFETPDYSKRLLADLKANPNLKGLVFDVRENGGGDSGIGEAMISMLIDRSVPLKQSESMSYSPIRRAWNSPQRLSKLSAREIAPSKDFYFRGPVAVLVGPRTFSAAEDFVSAFLATKRGVVIGQSTGGSTGQPMFFSLPGGGSARICVKRDYMADGTSFIGKGIAPHVTVANTAADLREGRDTELERALVEVKRNQKG